MAPRAHALCLLCALLQLHLCCNAQPVANSTAGQQQGSTIDPRLVGLEQKPIFEQLMARKSYLADYVQGEAFKGYLAHQQRTKYSQAGNQRGILIVAGGRNMFANAAITIMVLRKTLRSSLPVEIIHYGSKEQPDQEVLALLLSLNSSSSSSSNSTAASGPVFVTDALKAAPQQQLGLHHKQLPEITGFPAKVFALVHATRFQQVLLLDADSMPLVDPDLLFDLPSFRRSGNLFWPDLWNNAWINSTIYSLMAGMSAPPWDNKPDFRLVDSGQVLFDRVRHAEVLQYLWLLNSHHEWVYKHMHGDKDTFLLAFAMAGQLADFRQVPCFVRDAMVEAPGHEHRYHHLGMVQSVPPGVLSAAAARALRAGSSSAAQLLLPPVEAVAQGHQSHADATSTSTNDSNSSQRTAVATPLGLRHASRIRREMYARIGTPVVFHRTSFNSKFFPDCLDKNKIASKYCEVQYVSIPLSNEQASNSLKPHMYAFNADQVTTKFYEEHCKLGSISDTSSVLDDAGSSGTAVRLRHLTLAVVRYATAAVAGSRAIKMQVVETANDQVSVSATGMPGESDQSAAAVAAAAGDGGPGSPHLSAGSSGGGIRQQQLQLLQGHRPGQLPQGAAKAGDANKVWLPITSHNWRQLPLLLSRLLPSSSQPSAAASKPSSNSGQAVAGAMTAYNEQSTTLGRRILVSSGSSSSRVLTQASTRLPDMKAAGSMSGVQLQQLVLSRMGPPPEWQCDRLRVGEGELPVPVMKAEHFRHMQGVLLQSYEAFRQVRQRLHA